MKKFKSSFYIYFIQLYKILIVLIYALVDGYIST